MNIIKIENLSKKFKNIEIISKATATFNAGEIYGILGPNGSGKSVLLQMICGLMKPTTGNVFYNGHILDRKTPVLPSCGIIINKPAFFSDLDGFHNLKLLAKLKNTIDDNEIKEVMEKVKLKMIISLYKIIR